MLYRRRLITKQLGRLLLERKVITYEQLESALAFQRANGGFLSNALLAMGYANEADIASCLSSQYGFPYLPLNDYSIDSKIIKLVPAELARQCDLIPIDKIGNILTVVMVEPLNLSALEELKVVTGCRIQPFIGTKTDVENAILKYYGSPHKDYDRKEKAQIIPSTSSTKFIDIKGEAGIERRRFLRISSNVSFHYAFQEEHKKGESKNISAIGLLFVSENIIPLWTFLVLKIQIPGEKLPVKAVGQVVRVDSLDEKFHDIAIHLTHVQSQDREAIDKYVINVIQKNKS